jgi:hypothetical protein
MTDYNVSFVYNEAVVLTTITTDDPAEIIGLAQDRILDTLGFDVSTARDVDVEEIGE